MIPADAGKSPRKIEMATDGACRYNPGPGGWAAVVIEDGEQRTLSGGADHTTNNRMELTAVVEGLASLEQSCEVTVYTDSRYVCDGITTWIHGWLARDWKNAEGRPVRNQDLWELLVEQARRHTIAWTWVKGHAQHQMNQAADRAAGLAVPHNVVRIQTGRNHA